jgi:hypothetical protein
MQVNSYVKVFMCYEIRIIPLFVKNQCNNYNYHQKPITGGLWKILINFFLLMYKNNYTNQAIFRRT